MATTTAGDAAVMMLTDIGLFSATLLWVALLVKLTRRWLPAKILWLVAAAALGVAMLPLNGLVLGSYIFSLISWLSIPSLLLILLMLVVSCCGDRFDWLKSIWASSYQWLPVYIFFVFSGALLYPMAGGLTMFDPYRLGFMGTPVSWLLPLYLLSWAVFAVSCRFYLLLALLVAAVLAYYLKLLPSLNLWDYTAYVLIVLYSLYMLCKHICIKLFKTQASN